FLLLSSLPGGASARGAHEIVARPHDVTLGQEGGERLVAGDHRLEDGGVLLPGLARTPGAERGEHGARAQPQRANEVAEHAIAAGGGERVVETRVELGQGVERPGGGRRGTL